jgi:hypothetical protein
MWKTKYNTILICVSILVYGCDSGNSSSMSNSDVIEVEKESVYEWKVVAPAKSWTFVKNEFGDTIEAKQYKLVEGDKVLNQYIRYINQKIDYSRSLFVEGEIISEANNDSLKIKLVVHGGKYKELYSVFPVDINSDFQFDSYDSLVNFSLFNDDSPNGIMGLSIWCMTKEVIDDASELLGPEILILFSDEFRDSIMNSKIRQLTDGLINNINE